MSEMARGEEQLLVSEEATANGAVTISPTDMDGNAVTLTNETEQVRETGQRLHQLDVEQSSKVVNVSVPLMFYRTSLWVTGG